MKASEPSQWETTQLRAIWSHKIRGNQPACFCIYTFTSSSIFADIKLATIQKKAQQLCAEICGIYTTTKHEKATVPSIGE